MASNSRSTAKNRVNNDPVDELKRRSRRRLVGAIALFLAAIVIVPALVETEPAQAPSKVELIVPDRPSADINPDIENSTAKKTEATPEANKQASPPTQQPSSQAVAPPQAAPVAPPPLQPAPEPAPPTLPTPVKPAVEPNAAAAKKPEVKKPEDKKPEVKKPEAQKTEDDLIAKFAKEDQEAFWVQVAAVGDKARADALRKELGAKGFSSKIEPVTNNGATVYRVRVGPYAGQDKADAAKSQLGAAGYTGRVVQ